MKTKIALGESFVVDGVRLAVVAMPSAPIPVKLVVNGTEVVLYRSRRQNHVKAIVDDVTPQPLHA